MSIIIGVGTDFIDKSRIETIYRRFGQRFVERILSVEEQNIFPLYAAVDFLAKRFAGKEAVAKALGTGIGEKMAFNEISITKLPTGQPVVTLLGKSNELINTHNIGKIHISLSDEKEFALAFVVVEVKYDCL